MNRGDDVFDLVRSTTKSKRNFLSDISARDINLPVKTICFSPGLGYNRLFPKPNEHIKPDKKGFKPDDHVVGKFPEKLVKEETRLADRLQSSLDEGGSQAVGFERKDIEKMNSKKYQ